LEKNVERRLQWKVTKVHLAIQGIVDFKYDKTQIFFQRIEQQLSSFDGIKGTPTIVKTPILFQPQTNLITIQQTTINHITDHEGPTNQGQSSVIVVEKKVI
jgi:hypothetical protein